MLAAVSSSVGDKRQKILIELGEGVEDAVCAEPKIAALKDAEITVRGRYGEFFRNHPNVGRIVESGRVDKDDFDKCLNLLGLGDEEVDADSGDCPKIYLDSFDFVRILKFNISTLSHPRIAIAAGGESDSCKWDDARWKQLCEILQDKMGASLVQLGWEGQEFLGLGKDLVGKVGVREAAAVISRCDMVISTDKSYAWLAGAVDTPSVVLSNRVDLAEQESIPGSVTVAKSQMKDISVQSVIDSIVELCVIAAKE